MTLLPIHVVAGVTALVFGYVALFAAKAGTLHRKSGMLLVYAMVTLSVGGIVMAAGRAWAAVNIPAGLYWLGRVRIRRSFLGIVGVSTPQVSGATK